VVKFRPFEFPRQIVALRPRRQQAVMIDTFQRAAFDQLRLAFRGQTGARYGPVAAAAPALVALALLVAVAAPRQIAEIFAVVAG